MLGILASKNACCPVCDLLWLWYPKEARRFPENHLKFREQLPGRDMGMGQKMAFHFTCWFLKFLSAQENGNISKPIGKSPAMACTTGREKPLPSAFYHGKS